MCKHPKEILTLTLTLTLTANFPRIAHVGFFWVGRYKLERKKKEKS